MLLNWANINNIAVIGASKNKYKYGYIIVEKLIAKGYKLFPVNPKLDNLLGQKVYANIIEVIDKIDLVVLVLPPKIALSELKKVLEINPNMKVIVQPGAESEELINYVKNNNYQNQVFYNTCVMVISEDKTKS